MALSNIGLSHKLDHQGEKLVVIEAVSQLDIREGGVREDKSLNSRIGVARSISKSDNPKIVGRVREAITRETSIKHQSVGIGTSIKYRICRRCAHLNHIIPRTPHHHGAGRSVQDEVVGIRAAIYSRLIE